MTENINQLFKKHSLILALAGKKEMDLDEQRKRILFSFFMAFVIPALIIFGIIHIKNGNSVVGILNFIIGFALTSITFVLRYLKYGLNVYRVSILSAGSLLIYWLKLGGTDGSYSLWIFAIPIFSFYLLGKKEGLIWMLLLFLSCLVVLLMPREVFDSYDYSISFKIRLIVTFILIAFSTYNYEKVREFTWKQMNIEQANLKKERKKIISSIEYAQIIQNSLLPSADHVDRILPDNFLIWQPRDIVGGDIYYIDSFSNGFIVAVIDCTGHGVPGAFMTMLASSGLRRITVDEKCLNPGEILGRLNTIIKTSLQQDSQHVTSDDGLDASICYVNRENNTLTYAGARLPLFFCKKNEINTIKGDRQSIGYKKSNLNFKFSNHTIEIQDDMVFYLYTDGIIDQLGGEKRVCFGKKRLSHILLKNHHKPFNEQREIILELFNDYLSDNEVQDDLTIIGFRV